MHLARLVGLAPTLTLTTERLVLRRLRADDAPTALAHEQDRRIMRWIHDPLTPGAMRDRVEAMQAPWGGDDGEWLALAIAARSNDEPIGFAFFRVTALANDALEIGYRLAPAMHRRGYGHEALRELMRFLFEVGEAHRLVASCVAENEPSWRLLEKLGMRREGLLRAHSRLDGAWRDECVYGLLAAEWRSRARGSSA